MLRLILFANLDSVIDKYQTDIIRTAFNTGAIGAMQRGHLQRRAPVRRSNFKL